MLDSLPDPLKDPNREPSKLTFFLILQEVWVVAGASTDNLLALGINNTPNFQTFCCRGPINNDKAQNLHPNETIAIGSLSLHSRIQKAIIISQPQEVSRPRTLSI